MLAGNGYTHGPVWESQDANKRALNWTPGQHGLSTVPIPLDEEGEDGEEEALASAVGNGRGGSDEEDGDALSPSAGDGLTELADGLEGDELATDDGLGEETAAALDGAELGEGIAEDRGDGEGIGLASEDFGDTEEDGDAEELDGEPARRQHACENTSKGAGVLPSGPSQLPISLAR